MNETQTIQAILTQIEQGRRFLVASHENPDGDAVASTLALSNALREMGKDVVAYNADAVPDMYRFLPGAETLSSTLPPGELFDVGFVLDAGELRRAGSQLRQLCKVLVNVDHHPYSEKFGDIHYVDDNASATGALIYRILHQGQFVLSPEVALCIYTAILSDTGSFRYSNANPEAFRIASEMVETGVQPWQVATGLYESQPAMRLKLLAKTLSTLHISECGRYAAVTTTTEMFAETGAGAEYTDGFVNYPRSIQGVEVSLFFRQVSSQAFKVGFRSKGRVDVGALARHLGGGGHHNAAGAIVEGPLDQVQAMVFSRLDQLLGPC